MSYQDIEYGVSGHIATITLNRPDRLNAWTHLMENEMRSALAAAEADDQVRAVVITGAGRGFCAGADMSLLNSAASGERDSNDKEDAQSTSADDPEGNFSRKFSYLLRVSKPIIAAINGPVAGIGLCMTLFCDFRFMADNAKLTTAFSRRGLIAEHGASWMLPRLVGTMNALDLLYSGRLVQADEAQSMGLVKTFPAEGFLATVESIVEEMVTLSSPRSIGVMKRQVFDGLFQSLSQAWDVADREMVASFDSNDFKEGVAHFMEKRAPNFTGS
ncbi:enoyl-CoA hydratase [Alcanivorax balearicus MACL04]|uniref:Enoyl-CoA hydratase n=1 Tax=Alloalcanivorax balearicus MACL04 TaxID=1177182 RepID=A0ABT2QYV1_9GAMM|nr:MULTISPECIES: enoyl-CoA hydratase [Alloalcanivorax]MCU5782701.1 enoyl-CoA hydratase [Alloalcanivorax balearicus MACL04]PHS64648.1 MAG: enoyl-CoA hydratase [Alcanivorax sp.]CUR46437.1 Enoyl-CoA hydratase [Alloalcanivorax xenomutans]